MNKLKDLENFETHKSRIYNIIVKLFRLNNFKGTKKSQNIY